MATNYTCEQCGGSFVSDRLKQYLEYVRNTGGGATIADFKEDWEPIGDKLWNELIDAHLVRTDQHGHIRLTDAGVARLR